MKLLALLATLALIPACIERRLTIRTDPPGARVTFDGDELAEATPVTFEILHHGTHRVELEKEGCVPRVEAVKTQAPWYDYFPIDLFAELWPGTLRSETVADVKLEARPVDGPPDEDLDRLLERAESTRDRVLGED